MPLLRDIVEIGLVQSDLPNPYIPHQLRPNIASLSCFVCGVIKIGHLVFAISYLRRLADRHHDVSMVLPLKQLLRKVL